ncbi:caspase, EACC1-associated type [Streptomyces gilvosporeus]|uniref:Oligopeptide-binding lipoprotein n=1 Tax=Streptomyces gilvosporeus TaxID=553510 RepID=A0A1V0TLY3_9ACTN|nr:ABC transporter substrate-binding protein [Streptomyces gilvosporeus]ARF53870.1 oligopeptide-binding lipoprotein [Streptomyces gilvosporeus]
MTDLPDPAASRALLIGVHAYEHLEGLPAVARNLDGLTQAFTDPALWGLPESHCVALSQPRSAQQALDALSEVARRVTDTLVVYYAGHGLTDPDSDELYLALPGSHRDRLYSALPYEWVRRAILDPRIAARHKVVILDCCYSGRALLGGMSGTGQVADQALIDGTSLLAASAETRKALSPPGEEFTAFTGELITALTEGIAGGPALLDMQTLYRHLHTELAAKSRPLPQQRNRNTGGQIALARNRAYLSVRTDPPPPAPPPTPPQPVNPPPRAGTSAPTEPSPSSPPRESAPRTEGYGRLRTLRSPRALTIAAVSAVLVAGVSTSLALWSGSSSDGSRDEGKTSAAAHAKGAVSKAEFDIASGHVLRPARTKGGTLKFVSATTADSWDPQRTYGGFVGDFSRYYSRQLMTYATSPGAQGTNLVPDLAAAPPKITDGGRTYTFMLRDGVTWEDGSRVTSADVKYGIERLWARDVIDGGPTYLLDVLDPKGAYRGPYADTSKAGLKAVQTPDEKTIVFKLPKPNGDFEQMLAMPAASPVKQSRDTKALYGRHPLSNGPYKFQSDGTGRRLVLVRNSHWQQSSDPIRKALPDSITVSFVTDAHTMDNGLIKGDYDLALDTDGLQRSTGALVLTDANLRKNLDNPASGWVSYAAFPRSVKPLDNVHCRMAIIYATDHQGMQSAVGGPVAGGALAPNLSPPGIRGADPTFDPYDILKGGGRPDMRKAERELRSCGRSEGFSTTMAVRSDKQSDTDAAESLQASLNRVGITTHIAFIDAAQAQRITGAPRVVQEKGYGIVLSRGAADYPTGQSYWKPLVDGRSMTSNGNANMAEVDSGGINALLDEAVAESDPGKAARLYDKINHEVADGAYYLPIVYDKRLSWRGPRLTNVYVSSAYGTYDYVSLGVSGS